MVTNYADDNTLSVFAKILNNAISNVRNVSLAAIEWFKANYMLANPDKLQFLVLSPNISEQPECELDLGTVILTNDLEAKLLGVTIDSKLNFTTHVKTII